MASFVKRRRLAWFIGLLGLSLLAACQSDMSNRHKTDDNGGYSSGGTGGGTGGGMGGGY